MLFLTGFEIRSLVSWLIVVDHLHLRLVVISHHEIVSIIDANVIFMTGPNTRFVR